MRLETPRHIRSMSFGTACLLVLGLTPAMAQAPYQAPYLVKDINTLTGVPSARSSASDLVAVGSLLLFKGCDAYHGCELWKSDGTVAGTVMVKDIMPGSGSGASTDGYYSTRSTAVNGTLFFVASDGLHVPALWKSDGTEAGTVMVKVVSTSGGNVIEDLTNVNGTLFFTAVDYGAIDVHGRELWKSDGTEAGTTLVADITPGQEGGGPRDLTNVNGTLFFSADDLVHGRELWKSDGTPGGTRMVKDINPGAGGASTWKLAAVNGTLFFEAYDAAHGSELWKSDGTEAGTMIVKDINPGAAPSNPSNLTSVSGTLFFTASDGAPGVELWKSDGTTGGTVIVKVLPAAASGSPLQFTSVNGALFFSLNDGTHGQELWRSDGTTAGTVMLRDINQGSEDSGPNFLTKVGGTLFFTAWDGAHGGLWKSDGTQEGTVIVRDISPGYPEGSFTNVNGTLFFTAYKSSNEHPLWKSDGTPAGTVMVRSIGLGPASSGIESLVSVNGTAFFAADDGVHGSELWKSDGTTARTVMVKDFNPGATSWLSPTELTDVNGTVFFVADDGVHGHVLWKSDGTEAGTVMVKDFIPGPFDDWPSDLTSVNGTLFFVTEASYTAELWKSDGTAAGTVLVKGFPLSEDGVPPNTLTSVNGTLFFVATDGTHGLEWWKSDGTAPGTVMVKDVWPGPATSVYWQGGHTNVGGTLFFAADDGVHGQELWKSDGTAAGTVMVKDINPGGWESLPQELTNVNGTLFFVAFGNTLWKSDGTAAGTVMVKDPIPGPGPYPYGYWDYFGLSNVNGTLFFWANGTEVLDGFELWKSDGTVAGTTMVKHFDRGPFSGPPARWEVSANVQGILFFAMPDGVHGRELWRSDGTEAGTALVADLNPGVVDSSPGALTAAGPVLFFVADNGVVGRELWAIAPPTITNDDGMAIASRGQAVTYTIAVTNPGGQLFEGRTTVTDTFPPALESITWTCTATGGAYCTASGSGDISDMVDLPGRSSVTYQATATLSPSSTGTVSNTATFTVLLDSSTLSATDVDVIAAPQGFFTLAPCRLVDTRGASAPNGGPALPGQTTRVFTAAGNCGIPPTARAISVNIAAIRPRAAGHVRLFPTSQSLPIVSTTNYAAGQTRSGNAVVALNASGQFSAFVGQPLETAVDLVVDVTGYFE